MKKERQFGVLGLGHFGEAVAHKLSSLGADVIVVDRNEDKILNIANQVTYAVQADVSDINALKSIGLKNVDVVIINITSDINANLMAVLNCEELGIPIIYSKTNSDQHAKVLKRLGVSRVINPEKDMGNKLALDLLDQGYLHQLDLDDNYSIADIYALKSWENKTLNQLDLRRKYGINVIAIVHGDETNVVPAATDIIQRNDKLVLLGQNHVLDEIKKRSEE